MSDDKELDMLANAFGDLAGDARTLSWDEFKAKPCSIFTLSQALSELLSGTGNYHPFKPYRVMNISDNNLAVFSFYGYAHLHPSSFVSYDGKTHFIETALGKAVKTVSVSTENGIYSLALYLTVFKCKNNKSSPTTESGILLDSMKQTDIRNLDFELVEYWANSLFLRLESFDFMTNQSNEKLFKCWIKELREKTVAATSSEVMETILKKFIKSKVYKKTA